MPVEIEERAALTSSLDPNFKTNPALIKSILKTHSSQPISAEITIAAREQYFRKDLDLNKSIVLKAVMERPKSAKHNIERYKKSFYSNYKRNMTANRNLAYSTNTNYSDNENNIIYQNLKLKTANKNNNENLIMNDQDANDHADSQIRSRKEQRMQMSKSAFAGSIAKLRPQSARHNLEKYRQDVLLEKQKNMQKKLVHTDQFDSIMNNDEVTDNSNSQLIDMENFTNCEGDNIDTLDGLLIREEDDDSSSDEVDSQSSLNEVIPHPPPQPNSKYSQKFRNTNQQQKHQPNRKQKLLERREVVGELADQNLTSEINQNTSIDNADHIEKENLNNLRNLANNNNTYEHDPHQSRLKMNPNYSSNSISLNSVNRNTDEFDDDSSNAKHLDVNDSIPCTNSSSSSSTSSQQLTSNLTTQKEDCLHLNNTLEEETFTQENRPKPPINNLNDLVSQKLLNEWNRNDEEVELTIEKLNDFDTNNANQYIEYETTKNILNNKSQKYPPRNSTSQKQQIILLNTAGRGSRLSDFSTNSNKLSSSNGPNNQNFMTREKSSSSMDPWTRRNPTLVAQNVLLKHRTELEQLHNNRHNNMSRQSNNTSSNILATTNKYLLPDTKYYKKSNNF